MSLVLQCTTVYQHDAEHGPRGHVPSLASGTLATAMPGCIFMVQGGTPEDSACQSFCRKPLSCPL